MYQLIMFMLGIMLVIVTIANANLIINKRSLPNWVGWIFNTLTVAVILLLIIDYVK